MNMFLVFFAIVKFVVKVQKQWWVKLAAVAQIRAVAPNHPSNHCILHCHELTVNTNKELIVKIQKKMVKGSKHNTKENHQTTKEETGEKGTDC